MGVVKASNRFKESQMSIKVLMCIKGVYTGSLQLEMLSAGTKAS